MTKMIEFTQRTLIALSLMLISLHASAELISYDFDFSFDGNTYLTGYFTAEDSNNDGFVRDAEMLSLTLSYGTTTTANYVFGTSSDDNFNFDINNMQFLVGGNSNGDFGQRWNISGPGVGYAAGDNCDGVYVDSTWQGCVARPATLAVRTVTPRQPSTPVPAPAGLALFAIGLLALRAARKSA